MNWQQGNPTGKGLYLCRTTEGFGGLEVGYQVIVWNGYWNRLPQNPTITHWVQIDEPVVNENRVYRDPLGRLNIMSTDVRGTDLYDIGPGVSN